MNSEETVLFGVPLIVQFQYLQDCSVKIPAVLREKDEKFYMKSPVKPDLTWNLNLIIHSISFPEVHPIKIYKSPFGEIEYWTSAVLRKVAQSEGGEVHEIEKPELVKLDPKRKTERFFFLNPVKASIGNASASKAATCIDLSEDGLGLKFQGDLSFEKNEKFRICFEKPYQDLPEINGKLVRSNFNVLDQSTFVGISLDPSSKLKMIQIIKTISERQANDAFKFSNAFQKKGKNDPSSIFNLFD